MSGMVREQDNMNLPRSQSVKRPEVYRQNIINYNRVSCKLTSSMRFHVITDGFSDLRYHNTTKPRIDFRFDDSQRFGCIGQPSHRALISYFPIYHTHLVGNTNSGFCVSTESSSLLGNVIGLEVRLSVLPGTRYPQPCLRL